MSPNLRAFLDMIAHSELGAEILAQSDNGYNVLVGSTPGHVLTFSSYADHPRRRMSVTIKARDGATAIIESTAAGRYQILQRYFDAYRMNLGLPDFGPGSQDRIAVQMIRECRAIANIEAGQFETAVRQCSSRWASLPGAPYGQHVNPLAPLQAAYVAAGGTVVA
jgi:muramidase (phage lysozyme)